MTAVLPAGETDAGYAGVLNQRNRGLICYQGGIHHAGGDPGFFCQPLNGECREGCDKARFQDHRVADGQCLCDLQCRDEKGKVPWGDDQRGTSRFEPDLSLSSGQHRIVENGLLGRQDGFCMVGEVSPEVGRREELHDKGFCDRLALLGDNQIG